MTHWLAWYTQGRRFASFHTEWRLLPATGCLGVVVLYKNGNRTIHCGDWHWITPWDVASLPGTLPGVVTPPPLFVPEMYLKKGETVPDDEWARVLKEIEAAARGT